MSVPTDCAPCWTGSEAVTLVLSQEELVELTDYRRPADQRRWLSERGIPYWTGASGRPKVLRENLTVAEGGNSRGRQPRLRLP